MVLLSYTYDYQEVVLPRVPWGEGLAFTGEGAGSDLREGICLCLGQAGFKVYISECRDCWNVGEQACAGIGKPT